MIPWIDLAGVGVFGVSIFAATNALALLAGATLFVVRLRARGWPAGAACGATAAVAAAGALGAHALAVFAYAPEIGGDDLMRALADVANGGASTGGLAAGALATVALARLARRDVLSVVDAAAGAACVAWAIGRVGCFLVHDHPGVESSLPIAVAFPGGSRFDNGLLEAVFLTFLSIPVLRRPPTPPGGATVVFFGAYGVGRFVLDFLRIGADEAAPLVARGVVRAADVDPRYAGLTAAQFVCVGFVVCAAFVARGRQRAAKEAPRTL